FDHLAGAGEQYGQHLDAKALELAVGVIGGSSGRPIPVNYLFALTICKGLSSPLHTRDGAPRLIQSTAIKPCSRPLDYLLGLSARPTDRCTQPPACRDACYSWPLPLSR